MRVSGDFEEYHRRILGSEYGEFETYLSKPRNRLSLRVNSLKASREQVVRVLEEGGFEWGPVSWCRDGLWVSGFPEFEHQLGWFYVVDAASLVPASLLGVDSSMSVLDLCAAPGGKSTQLAADMDNQGLLVVNEPNYKRIRSLVYNIQRCGVSNAVVTKFDGCGFEKHDISFDRVLVDAPCSGVGTAGKNRDVLKDWSLERILRFSGLQKKLASSAFMCLKPGGVLVYSTCTTSLEEDEGVVEHLLESFDSAVVEKAGVEGLVSRRGLTPLTRRCLRVYGHLNGTTSFFIARVRKDE